MGHSIGTAEWPPKELYEALAIAQHHGVPTRLLDFSYDPLIAAYFAAENPPPAAEEIAVWCVDLQLIALAGKNGPSPVEVVTVPRVRNINLAAQKALFLLETCRPDNGSVAMETSIGKHIRDGQRSGLVTAGTSGIRIFCLPVSECRELVKLLRKLHVDRAHLMPSFDGVVQELKSRREGKGSESAVRSWPKLRRRRCHSPCIGNGVEIRSIPHGG